MITSLTNQKIKEWMKLHTKKGRQEAGLFLVEENHLIEEALKANVVETIISVDECYYPNIDIELVDIKVMNKLSKNVSSVSKIAVCRISEIEVVKMERVLLLDNLQDPGNVGTIIRTAVCFGFDSIIVSEDTVDIYNEKCIRATQGAIFRLNIIKTDIIAKIKELKELNFIIFGTSLTSPIGIDNVKAVKSMAFVLGNEGAGVSENVLNHCDQNIIIPINKFESLNVGIAAGIICYKFRGVSND